MTSDERKRELKRQFRDAEKTSARAKMILNREQLQSLLSFVEASCEKSGCSEQLTATAEWARQNGIDFEALKDSLSRFGGFCDCEVAANVDPDEIY